MYHTIAMRGQPMTDHQDVLSAKDSRSGSDSEENAQVELAYFFSRLEYV